MVGVDEGDLLQAIDGLLAALGIGSDAEALAYIQARTVEDAAKVLAPHRENAAAVKAAGRGLVALLPGSSFLTESLAARSKLKDENAQFRHSAALVRLLLGLRRAASEQTSAVDAISELLGEYESRLDSQGERLSELQDEQRRPPLNPAMAQSDLKLQVHQSYARVTGQTGFEIRPAYGEIPHWRFAFPRGGPAPSLWGVGAADGGAVSSVKHDVVTGTFDFDGVTHVVVGCGDPITTAIAAYLAFQGPIPRCFYFAGAEGPRHIPEAGWLPLAVG